MGNPFLLAKKIVFEPLAVVAGDVEFPAVFGLDGPVVAV